MVMNNNNNKSSNEDSTQYKHFNEAVTYNIVHPQLIMIGYLRY